MLAYGHGSAADPVKAWQWLNLAEAAGVQRAARHRRNIEIGLSGQQLAAAKIAVAEWTPRNKRQRDR
jgi:TPR repeat protein